MSENLESIRATGGSLLRGPSTKLSSSLALGWNGVAVERHIAEPGEKPEIVTSHHMVELASGDAAAYGERCEEHGRLMPYAKEPGMLSVFAKGAVPFVRPSTKTELIVCVLDPGLVSEIAEESEETAKLEVHTHVGLRDEGVAAIIRLLETEATSGGVTGGPYVEHLTFALALRLLRLGNKGNDCPKAACKLPQHRLQRVVDRMEADLPNLLDLKTLAAESGYSRNHFLRMFRAATGLTPHQYLLHLRVRKAQSLLKSTLMNLLEIALACGFSSHAQLSRTFRQVMGITPSDYRRDHLKTSDVTA